MTEQPQYRATYRGMGPYKGVVKNGKGEIVVECEHWHRNRDSGSAFAGPAARSCAFKLLAEVDPESARASLPAFMREER